MTLHFWNAPDGVGSHKEVGIHPAGHVTSQRCVRSNQVVSVYNTCEKFLCSGFFLWSARWNWPFLSPQDFGVAWEATFTQVPAREFKKYIINSQVKQKSSLICYMSCIRNMAMKPLFEDVRGSFLTPHSKTCIKLTGHYTSLYSLYSTENRGKSREQR